VEQVAPGIHRLGRRLHNFYLVVSGGRATVIDAGGSRELPLLEAGLGAAGLTLDDVEALLVTHAHTDHLGFAPRARRRGVTVKVHEDEAPYAMDVAAGSQVGARDLPLWRPRVVVFLAEMVRAGAHLHPRLDAVDTVADGERLDLPGRPRVVATPGHTAGHAAYLLEEHRAVCTGDALVTDAIIRRSPGPQLLPERFHTDAVMARTSLDRLAGLDADLVLPGHGPPWRGSLSDAVVRARTR
jgi:glyoxylase-like metal-dependent hydrolase (beta-lactamase superfamily II)